MAAPTSSESDSDSESDSMESSLSSSAFCAFLPSFFLPFLAACVSANVLPNAASGPCFASSAILCNPKSLGYTVTRRTCPFFGQNDLSTTSKSTARRCCHSWSTMATRLVASHVATSSP